MKNIYLSKSEQDIFNLIKDRNVISNDELKHLFRKKNINKIAHSLMNKGYLYNLKKGLYLINKTPSKEPVIEDPFNIAQSLYKGYIGFSSALKIHNLLDYEPFTIYLITSNKSKELELGQYIIKIINFGEKAYGFIKKDKYIVSTPDKTFFDCFYKPKYIGYNNIIKAIKLVGKLDWDSFLKYFEKHASSSLHQRTGYILESHKLAPKKIINYFSKKVKNNTKLDPGLPGKGKYIKKWKLIDNTKNA
ncbi:hypothetical protein GF327_02715 [Candidatus Woesearchaeota archaeon]|nr:hypothetical protein [Candidatus Woesearchaeota archaeon]